MNVRMSADSPPDGGKDPADFTLDKIGINKLNDNVLMKNPRMIIFFSHDCPFPIRCPASVRGESTRHGFGSRPTR